MTTDLPVHIGRVVHNAVAFNAQNWRNSTMTHDDLLTAVDQLFALLDERKITYVLVGGIAMLHYIQGRNTEDIDLILSTTALKKIPEITTTSADVNFAHGTYGSLQIDFLLTKNRLFSKVQRAYTVKQPFFERTITCATVEGLLLLKLYALPSLYRQGNFARVGLYENDIATLLFYYQIDLTPLLKELETYLSPQDMTAIQETLQDIQGRIRRFNRDGV